MKKHRSWQLPVWLPLLLEQTSICNPRMCKSPPPPLFILEIRENSKSESEVSTMSYLGRGQLGHFIALGRGEILNYVEVSSESEDQKSEREDN